MNLRDTTEHVVFQVHTLSEREVNTLIEHPDVLAVQVVGRNTANVILQESRDSVDAPFWDETARDASDRFTIKLAHKLIPEAPITRLSRYERLIEEDLA
jgi:hypothetical protein